MNRHQHDALAECLGEMAMAIRDLASLVTATAYGGIGLDGRNAYRTAIDHARLAAIAAARIEEDHPSHTVDDDEEGQPT